MPSIADVLSTVESPVKAGIIKRAIEVSPVLSYLNFEQLNSINHRMFQEGALPRAANRDYNTAFSDGTVAPDEPINIQMTDFGTRIPMDPILSMEPTRFDGEYKAKVRAQVARSMGLDFKIKLLGTDQAETSGLNRGIYQWAKYWDSSTNDVRLSMGTNGLKLSGTNGMRIFITSLTKLWIRVRPTFFMADSTTMAVLAQLLREAAYTETYANEFTWETVNVGGRTQPQMRFKGAPFIDAGEDAARSAILPYTETEGSGTTCSSVIAVNASPENFTVIHRFPDLMMIREFVTSSDLDAISVHMPMAFEARHERSVGRLAGILAE
jgi:hypothetical protein